MIRVIHVESLGFGHNPPHLRLNTQLKINDLVTWGQFGQSCGVGYYKQILLQAIRVS